ncbi:MAG: potassium channel family protein [Solirubrobacteraceae bacterium]
MASDPLDDLVRFTTTVSVRARARRELLLFLRRLALLGALIVGLCVLGTIGFVVTEGTSAWDGFVWTLDTIATVGSVPAPTDTDGEAVKIALIILGVGTLFYGLVSITEFFVAGHVSGLLEERRQQRMIDSLSDHYLICGFGRVGRQVARDLRAGGAKYVVIDDNPENHELAQAVGVPFLEGSPSDDVVLRDAGIERARAIIACVDSDAENIFITLTARELCNDLTIVARASVEDSEKKLRRAGADRVISPYKTSGSEMARLALHPHVTGFVDVAPEYRIEEIEVGQGCESEGQTLADVRGGAIVVAVRKPAGDVVTQPPGETVLHAGDVLVALGTPRTLERLEALFAPAGVAGR